MQLVIYTPMVRCFILLNMIFSTDIIKSIKQGQIGVIPTDTLYGLVASAMDKTAVERVYEVRERNTKKPSIILIGNEKDLLQFGIKPDLIKLTESYWPGPYSLVLPVKDKKWRYLHRRADSLAFRLPDNEELVGLLNQTGPVIAPSANPEGAPPAANIAEAEDYFGDSVDFYVNGGELRGNPSTVISLTDKEPKVLRDVSNKSS